MLQVYRYLTYSFFPIFIILIYLRAVFNKEDKLRFKEKIFTSHFNIQKNRNKKLIWFHAASIGECLSIIPLIKEINAKHENIDFLITTVTLSSSKLLEKKLNQYQNTIHRFFPLDLENLAENFLNSWKPDLVCFVDSEIWPNFLFGIKKKKIPLLLVNARLTKKSYKKWKIFSDFAKKVFNNFDLCLAASEESRNNLNNLQVKNIKYIGNLKYSVKSDLSDLEDSNKKILNNFKTWCAASTHDGEELTVLKTHIEIKKKYNNVLTIVIPRHIGRSNYIKNLSKKFNLNAQILNENNLINSNIEILIINSFGVLPKYFSYCKNIFIGKSLVRKKQNIGGQNPIEAAKLGCKIFHGPYVYNFQEVYELLNTYGLSEKVNNELELSEHLIKNFESSAVTNQKKVDLLNNYGEKILKETVMQIEVYLKNDEIV
jgi:3-deoxy-D-manno-octulosonic-acid transferase